MCSFLRSRLACAASEGMEDQLEPLHSRAAKLARKKLTSIPDHACHSARFLFLLGRMLAERRQVRVIARRVVPALVVVVVVVAAAAIERLLVIADCGVHGRPTALARSSRSLRRTAFSPLLVRGVPFGSGASRTLLGRLQSGVERSGGHQAPFVTRQTGPELGGLDRVLVESYAQTQGRGKGDECRVRTRGREQPFKGGTSSAYTQPRLSQLRNGRIHLRL